MSSPQGNWSSVRGVGVVLCGDGSLVSGVWRLVVAVVLVASCGCFNG
jgi:hypothetical protein